MRLSMDLCKVDAQMCNVDLPTRPQTLKKFVVFSHSSWNSPWSHRSSWSASGWWLTYPSEKYEGQFEMIIPNLWKNKMHVPNHQPGIESKSHIFLNHPGIGLPPWLYGNLWKLESSKWSTTNIAIFVYPIIHPILPHFYLLVNYHNSGKSPCLMGKSTISTGPFSSSQTVTNYQRVS